MTENAIHSYKQGKQESFINLVLFEVIDCYLKVEQGIMRIYFYPTLFLLVYGLPNDQIPTVYWLKFAAYAP